MAITKYPAKHNAAKVAANLGLSEGLVYLKGDILKERHDTDVVSVSCPGFSPTTPEPDGTTN